jgi:hypothetical protein
MTRYWRIVREPSRDGATLGSLYLDGHWLSFTLEDEIRAEKVPGKTAIPAGVYPVRLTWSPKFQRLLPEVLDVPGFTGIRVHSGNRASDTEGCPLVGFARANAAVLQSKPAEAAVLAALAAAEDAGDEIRLVVENPPVFT